MGTEEEKETCLHPRCS